MSYYTESGFGVGSGKQEGLGHIYACLIPSFALHTMATLIRTKSDSAIVEQNIAQVPAPFPVNELQRIRSTDQQPELEVHNATIWVDSETEGGARSEIETTQTVIHELLPPIAYVQQSCLMTLNNLLSMPENWNPIVPDRRHSLPGSSQGTNQLYNELNSSNALQTLVTNLRNRDSPQEMIGHTLATTDAELIHELNMHVERISHSLAQADATLARALVSLLSHFDRLSTISTAASKKGQQSLTSHSSNMRSLSSSELLSLLACQLNDLRFERLSSQPSILGPSAPPVLAVEAALLWSRIDDELEMVLSLCRERAEDLFRSPPDGALPPQYDFGSYNIEAPPDYEDELQWSLEDTKSRDSSFFTASRSLDEKTRIDLENVTMAIDRLYQVAPQLHNQRVELKSAKLAEMERARQEGSSTAYSTLQEDKPDVSELENILDLIGKASERSLNDQSFVLDGGMQKRLEKAKQREQQQREAFVAELVRHSGSGRLHSQDAVYHPRDPYALLTLPEFIREPAPSEALRKEANRLSEPVQGTTSPPREINEMKVVKDSRKRSMSAPHLPWLRSGSRSPASGSHSPKSKLKSSNTDSSVELGIAYVAENHDNLRHIIIFLQVTGHAPGVDVDLDVPASLGSMDGGESFIVKSGPHICGPQPLPGRVLPGKKQVRMQNDYYEVKLPTLLSSAFPVLDETPLLDASQLQSLNPSSFVCSSCSLPVIQSSDIVDYRDLPSEHWQELVDAWMCHPDQKLHDHVAKHGMGFWPQQRQALVGGSYILFGDTCLSKGNLYIAEEMKRGEIWRPVRCLCGAVIGRCQGNQQGNVEDSPVVYRILKYAIRPISSTSDPPRIPLSAFVVGDMNEFVQAHATYRFVILDEEDERPRMLLWMFKPSIRLAYNMRLPRGSPKNASIHAAKVLYKLFRPSEDPIDLNSVLNKYPGFPQAEYLYYPMSICRQIANLLRESNRAYPESLRVMTGLEVGWLRRA
ncbi:hypothetical protein APHAL10511_006781 [Amanita phalloides]|nr:hypothetical protein APHAL10511_006781 [Amanita phalloides]